jgi:glycosyltransferase involved in cell wall biosynthesis
MIEDFLAPDGDRCTIVYTGTLSSYRYDTLLQALHWLKKSDPARAKELHVLFIGESTEVFAQEVAALDLSDIVTIVGPTSRAEIARHQREAHALLVLGRPPTMKGYELFAGAKLFEYLKAGRPIVGVVPADETKRILRRVGVSTIADVDSPDEIIAVIQQLLDAWSKGTLGQFVPNRAACDVYSAERKAAALVRALEGAPAEVPFVPGSVDIPPSLRNEIGNGGWVK